MSESENEFSGLLRHKYTVDVRFYLFTVGFRKCRIVYGRINKTPLYLEYMNINHEPVATRLMIDIKHQPDRVLVDV